MATDRYSRFPLGRLLVTPAALQRLVADGARPQDVLDRHARGDWGDVSPLDRVRNEDRLDGEGRLVSAYRGPSGSVLVVTERTPIRTTILLQDELTV